MCVVESDLQIKSVIFGVTAKARCLRLVPSAEHILLLAFLASPQAAKPLHGKHGVTASKLNLTMRFHITPSKQGQNRPQVKLYTLV